MAPEDVGILAMELYFPFLYVDQTELEKYDGVSEGKYTKGLGQFEMGFCTDVEDINSLCLTATKRLLENNKIDPAAIGCLEVGTETLIDKSKSVKSVLMQLFDSSANWNVEGIDNLNACFGGTQALFHAINWINSCWDGRYALVVIADIAVYAKGSARATGGAGACALLIGPNAPVVFDHGMRFFHMRHTYDFYKPKMDCEYPIVDGKLSLESYLQALNATYLGFCALTEKKSAKNRMVTLADFNAVLFHSPFCRLVQKSLARLSFVDQIRSGWESAPESLKNQFSAFSLEATHNDPELAKRIEQEFLVHSEKIFAEKTNRSLEFSRHVGNMYCPSLYAGLCSHLANTEISNLLGSKIALFSYGSGFASAMFSITVKNCPEKLEALVAPLRASMALLKQRRKVSPESFSKALKLREEAYGKAPYKPFGSIEDLFPGTFYLVSVDEKYRRTYARKEEEKFSGAENQKTMNGI